eukprot:gene6785-7496_t
MSEAAPEVTPEDLLIAAAKAEKAGRFEDSLSLYQKALQTWLEIYKNEKEGTDRKKKLLSLIESSMVEAERVKALARAATRPNRMFAAFRGFLHRKQEVNPPLPPSLPTVDSPSGANSREMMRISQSNSDLPASSKLQEPPSKVGQPKGPPSFPVKSSTHAKSLHIAKPTPAKVRKEKELPVENEYVQRVLDEMTQRSTAVRWEEIAGLAFAKQTLYEAVVLPNIRPDLFTGLRRPPRGVLLFGPPGTGKTMLAKAVATETGFAFFSVSAAAVVSKFLGEGEKLMRAVFETARSRQPAVIFFDEIDALMSTRKENEHEASRRLKTEFMTQLDGATTSSNDRVLIMAATNLPWELDEAVLRRLAKRIYIPLPDGPARHALINHTLEKQGPKGTRLSKEQLTRIVEQTEGYSGSDLAALCQEAALGPIREIDPSRLRSVRPEDVRPIEEKDFLTALQAIRSSVSRDHLQTFQTWAAQYGSTVK